MRQLTIEPEFRDKIPPLSSDEFSKLEENIVSDGEVREPLVVWKNTIIDGHHRWAIIQKHPKIPYKIKQMDFPDKWAAIVWMCRNQLGRRNLTDEQKTVIIGEAYKAQKMTQGGSRGNQYTKVPKGQNDHLAKKYESTAEKIADDFGVVEKTVRRSEHFLDGLNAAEEVSPGIKEAVLSGAVKAPKIMIAEIRKAPEEKKKEAVEAIRQGNMSTAKEILRPVKKEEPAEEPPPFTVSEFEELLRSSIKALDASLNHHIVLVHPEMLLTAEGREAADKVLKDGMKVIEKYRNIIRKEV